jgi:threonine dehydratase
MNTLRSLKPEEVRRGIITASGGNHGLAVAYAGHVAKAPATIYLPTSAPKPKVAKLEAWGAKVVVEGAVWDEANRAALAEAEKRGLTYIHPFADPRVIAGQATLGIEILEQAPELDTVLVAIGGGGLIAGIALAVKAVNPKIKVIGIEPTGAPTLYESVRAKRLVELSRIDTAAGTLAPRMSAALNLEIITKHVDEIMLVSDEEMRVAARWLWFEHGIAAELSGAASLALLLAGRYKPKPAETVCALVCGAGTDGL